ncbi:ABC transporter substrate-binding protein [Ramlibacter sp. WS9]|uniref:ABC transporter substrate-binding protein n=1 Tax=Ramlibacter sp. WS9 TaxID=1882741 RepID=UPI00130510A9|nr:ABC transporter substrate-binding protein [Ramlibacter sp. WS9]HSV36687.1 ABC transporter substrate-binding protein [Ramlibacter sp.]
MPGFSNTPTRVRHVAHVAAIVLALACPAACAAKDAGTIKVGAISTLTGTGISTEAVRGAKAYFDALNAAGGIRGKRIVLVSEDDRAEPQSAAAAANRLVADKDIVAMVGGSSVLECAVNHKLYEEAGLMSLPGGGIDPLCFGSPNIAPVNAGPYVSLANGLTFARTVLRHERLCVVSPALPGMVEAFQQAIDQWAKTQRVPSPPMEIFQLGDPMEPVVKRVAARACQSLVFTGPNVVEWARSSRPLLPGVEQIFLTPAYTTVVTQALGASGEGIYAIAEFEPWTSRSLQLNDWRALMTANKVPLSSLSQGGYLAAQMFGKAVRGISGPITRETVAKALREMAPVSNALTASPFVVGPGRSHNPNNSGIPMQLKDGQWRVAHSKWISFEMR